MSSLIIGTRGSSLALFQANHIRSLIEKKLNIHCKIKVIKTKGDSDQKTSLPLVGDKGFFTKEIESELTKKSIDLAVHSMKDLPTDLDKQFTIVAVSKRVSPYDVMITKKPLKFKDLPQKAILATGSLRRSLQIKELRPDLKIVDIRGNINTRLKNLFANDWHGVIMAEAAVKRLNLTNYYHIFSKQEMIPAAAQGVIAVETLASRNNLNNIISKINHKLTFDEVNIERKIIHQLDGGCKTPIGCLASTNKNTVTINTYLSNLSGNKSFKLEKSGPVKEKDTILDQIISAAMDMGAKKIIYENIKGLNV